MDAHKDAVENATMTDPGAIREEDSRMDRGIEKLKNLVLVDKEKILSWCEELCCKESEDLAKKNSFTGGGRVGYPPEQESDALGQFSRRWIVLDWRFLAVGSAARRSIWGCYNRWTNWCAQTS